MKKNIILTLITAIEVIIYFLSIHFLDITDNAVFAVLAFGSIVWFALFGIANIDRIKKLV